MVRMTEQQGGDLLEALDIAKNRQFVIQWWEPGLAKSQGKVGKWCVFADYRDFENGIRLSEDESLTRAIQLAEERCRP